MVTMVTMVMLFSCLIHGSGEELDLSKLHRFAKGHFGALEWKTSMHMKSIGRFV